MKLCYLADERSEHTRRWVSYFAQAGHEVHLLAMNGSRGDLPGVQVRPIARPRQPRVVRYVLKCLLLRHQIMQISPDVLHAHFVADCGRLAAFTGFRPLVLSAWGSDLYLHPKLSTCNRLSISWALRQADLITCDATDLRDAAIALGARADRVALVQHGVDTEIFRPDLNVDRVRERLRLSGAKVILSTRALEPLYNVDLIVQAFAEVHRHVPEAALIVKGTGSQRHSLEQLAARLGCEQAVRFVGHLPRHEDLAELYAVADVFVTAASSDSTPVSLLEAMACGAVPVICDLPALLEWVQDRWNGRVVPQGDQTALARSIVGLLRANDLRRSMLERNRALVLERADYYTNMTLMDELYHRVLATRP